MISCQFPVRHRIFQFEIVRTEMIAKHVDLVRQSCIVSAFATTNYPDKIFQGVRLYTYSRIAGCSTPLRPVLHADNTGKREFVLRVLDADVKRFMMPKDVLYIGLFSIGEIFQIFGIERLAAKSPFTCIQPFVSGTTVNSGILSFISGIGRALEERTMSPELRE